MKSKPSACSPKKVDCILRLTRLNLTGDAGKHRERKRMTNQKLRAMLGCSFFMILLLGKSTFAQEKSEPAAQDKPSDAKSSGQNAQTAKPKEEEPEANTNAGAEALQKATQNPVASLISVPIQNNNNFGISPGYRTQDVLNIQPVIPVGISKD